MNSGQSSLHKIKYKEWEIYHRANLRMQVRVQQPKIMTDLVIVLHLNLLLK